MQAFKQQSEELTEFLDFIEEDLENVRRTVDFVESHGLDSEFKVHAKSETAEESAEKTGINLDQIVKTLVFKNQEKFVAVLCPGDSRVSEEKLEEEIGGNIEMASPQEVKEKTGYIIGGVSPFDLDIDVLMEESLLEKDTIRPAAGSRVVGVEIDPEEYKEKINVSVERVIQ